VGGKGSNKLYDLRYYEMFEPGQVHQHRYSLVSQA
jgi:hypothetical protein